MWSRFFWPLRWPIDAVFGIGVRTINRLYATTNIEALKREGKVDFYRLLRMSRELQLTDAFGLRVEQKEEAQVGIVIFRLRQRKT